jgi:hypothetical protein
MLDYNVAPEEMAQSLALLKELEGSARTLVSSIAGAIKPFVPHLAMAYGLAGFPNGEENEAGLLQWIEEKCRENNLIHLYIINLIVMEMTAQDQGQANGQ